MEKSLRPVLYLTRHYLPTTVAAGIRAHRFVTALNDHNIKVILATVGEKPEIEEPSELLTICRVSSAGQLPTQLSGSLPRWPSQQPLPGPTPDPVCSKALYRAAHALIQKYQPEVLFATGLPFGLMAVAHRLAQQYHLKLALEFRDAWTIGKDWPYPSVFHRRRARKWEDRCTASAQLIITETDHQKKILDEHYGPDIAAKTLTIRHSFEKTNELSCSVDLDSEKFTITYTGQLRGLDITSTSKLTNLAKSCSRTARRILLGANFCEQLRLDWMSPNYLVFALAQAAQEDKEFAQKVRLIFVGEKFPAIDIWARRNQLTENIQQLGPVTPQYAQQLAHFADVRVLTLYGIKNLDYHWCVPGKTYAYLGSGKPILALVPPGEARDLVTQAGTGLIAPPDNINEIARQLLVLFRRKTTGLPALQPDWNFINQFHLPIQQKQFAHAIAKLAGWELTETKPQMKFQTA